MKATPVQVSYLFVSPGHNYYGRHGKGSEDHEIKSCDEIELVAGRGVRDDRFFDYKEDYKGQVTLFDLSTYQRVQSQFELPSLEPSAFRRNVLVQGIDLNSLIGKQFQLGPVTLEGTQEAKPCYWMDEACAPGVEDFLKGSGGLRCRILTGGILGKGTHDLSILENVS